MIRNVARLLSALALIALVAASVPVTAADADNADVTLTPEATEAVAVPDRVLELNFTVENQRATPLFNVRLTIATPDGWAFSFDPQDFSLAAGATREARLSLDVPADANPGTYPARVLATANGGDGRDLGHVDLVLHVPEMDAGDDEAPAFRVLAPTDAHHATAGEAFNLTFSVVNNEDAPRYLYLKLRAAGLTILTDAPDEMTVDPATTATVTVRLRAPADAEAGETFVNLVATPADGDADPVGGSILVSVQPAADGTDGNADPAEHGGDNATAPENDTSTSEGDGSADGRTSTPMNTAGFTLTLDRAAVNVTANATLQGVLTVENTGERTLTVTLAHAAPSPWSSALARDQVTVSPGATDEVEYEVRVPEAVGEGFTDVTFTGHADGLTPEVALLNLRVIADAPAYNVGEGDEAQEANAETAAVGTWDALYAEYGGLAVAGAAVSVGAAGGAAYFAGTASGRRRFWWLAAGLYTRLTKPTLLDHPERQRLYERIQENPGLHFHGLKRDLGWNTGTLTYHLRVLERHRMITSRKDQLMRRFYVQGDQPTDKPKKTQVGGLRGEVLDAVRERGEVPQADLTDLLGQSKQTINYHVKNLERMGLIEVEKQGRETVLRPLDPDADDAHGAAEPPVGNLRDQLRKEGVNYSKLR